MNARTPCRSAAPRLVALFLLALLASCASFARRELSHPTLEEIVRDGKLPAITYEFNESGQGATTELIVTDVRAGEPAVLRERIEPLFRRAFEDSKLSKEAGELHLDLYFRQTLRRPALTYTLALFFIGSLGILPAYAEEELYLEAKLRRGGATVKQYVYTTGIDTWFHWFMLPLAWSHDPGDVRDAQLDAMVLRLLGDLKRDLPSIAGAP